jgi:hypothetical protein
MADEKDKEPVKQLGDVRMRCQIKDATCIGHDGMELKVGKNGIFYCRPEHVAALVSMGHQDLTE